MAEKFGLTFFNVTQELLFGDYYNFLPKLNKKLEIVISKNRAYIGLDGQIERLCVFPSDDGTLHFEFSSNFFKPLDLETSFPVFCESNKDLDVIKMFTRYIFSLDFENPSKEISKQQETKSQAAKPQDNDSSQQKISTDQKATKVSIGDKSSGLQNRYIWEFF